MSPWLQAWLQASMEAFLEHGERGRALLGALRSYTTESIVEGE